MDVEKQIIRRYNEKLKKRKRDEFEEEQSECNEKLTTADCLSSVTFDELDITDQTKLALQDMNLTHLTKIQAECIPLLLEGKHIIGAAKTGTGKTLAFLIPILEILYATKFKVWEGTGAIIIVPTKELGNQICGVLTSLSANHNKTKCFLGAERPYVEKQKLQSGVNIVVGTPKGLLYHLQNTPFFLYKNLQVLVIDEADTVLDVGFEDDMKQIIEVLPKRRLTALFSATLNRKTQDLISLVMDRKDAINIRVDANALTPTVDGLKQGFVVCDPDKKLLLLRNILFRNQNKKVMVFMSSNPSVIFHSQLFTYLQIPCQQLCGFLNKHERAITFAKFRAAKKGILLCSDVAKRGLDIPDVDWIIQYDCPISVEDYIHRVGRTARGVTAEGNALLFLMPTEKDFAYRLQQNNIPLSEYEYHWDRIISLQVQFEKLIRANPTLFGSAKSAFRACMKHLSEHSTGRLADSTEIAKSFGLCVDKESSI